MSALKINDNGIDREMTPEEQESYLQGALLAAQAEEAREQSLKLSAAAKASARAKLKALGLTDAEIAALVG